MTALIRLPDTTTVIRIFGIVAIFLMLSISAAGAADMTVVRPEDTGEILCNPGMGWVLHHYDNAINRYGVHLEPSDTVDDFPGIGVIYLRLAWQYVEPKEGVFNWSIVDIPTQRWVDKDKKIALRFTCHESGGQPNATPHWVRLAGARGFESGNRLDTNGNPRWEPDYADPVFLEKLDHFLAAVAERYDGDPDVAFIDIGSIGIWGEGDPQEPNSHLSAATVKKHIDLHVRHFTQTPVVFNDNLIFRGRGIATMEYAIEKGLTFRDDSVLCRPGEEAIYTHIYADAFWPRLPLVLESEHYGISQDRRGDWGDGSKYLEAVERSHASYVSVHWYPREFMENNRELVDRISLRMGYRLQLTEAAYPPVVNAAGPMPVRMAWRNAGVAPCLEGGFATLTFKDEKDGIAGVFVDETLDMRTLPVAAPGEAETVTSQHLFHLPPDTILKPGTYDVYVSVGSRIGTPAIALPLADGDGMHRYRIGSITVDEAAPEGETVDVPAGWTTSRKTNVPGTSSGMGNGGGYPWERYMVHPLVTWPIIIDDHASLPWGNPDTWDDIDTNYGISSLVDDTMSLLGSQSSALARMETLRRALVYGRQEPDVCNRLLAALKNRMAASEATGTVDPLACFDYGYYIEAFKQAEWLDRSLADDINGFDFAVNRGIRIFGDDLEMLYGAGLMCLEPPGVHPYVRYHKTVVREAAEGSLPAKNLLRHFSGRGDTMEEMRESIYFVR